MVASGILHRPLAPTALLVARKGSRIRGARDLVGKKIAIDALNQLPHIAMRRWVKRNGVSEKDVEFREITFVGLGGTQRPGSDAHREVPQRGPGGVGLDQEKNHPAADAILSKYTLINRTLLRAVTRSYYAQRLVPRLAQPWIDAYAEFGIIPESFPAIQLVK